MGAAGGVKAADPKAEVVVYTSFDDVAYSPCGIPYVHGREIENFEKLFLASKQAYVDAGIDVHYNTDVTSVDVKRKVVQVASEGEVAWDTLVLATGFNYADPGVPGGDLGGLYYVKNIREAMEIRSGRAGLALRRRDGHGARAPRHPDASGGPEPVADVRGGRPGHHGSGGGVVARARSHHAFQHDPQGVRR